MRAAVLTLLVLLIPLSAFAAADIDRGREVALGLISGATPRTACHTCHGADGAGDGSGAFPRLTGQSAWYLYKQLHDYASGARDNDIMAPIAKTLREQQMQDVAAYYAAQTAKAHLLETIDAETLQRGGAIVAVGADGRAIAACVNCHGANARGVPPSFPYLAGQYASYVEHTLKAFRSGERTNSPLGVMELIAHQLRDEDIRAIALYLQSIPPPERADTSALVRR
jgi:cytochrome c553